MTNPTARLLDDIINFSSPVLELIDRARVLPISAEIVVLELVHAKSAVNGYLTGRVPKDELVSWARFLLGRRDITWELGYEWDLLELLEDISFSEPLAPFGTTEAVGWVTRLDLAWQ